MGRNYLVYFIIFFLLTTIGLQYFVYTKTSQVVEQYRELPVSGKASTAVVSMCINNLPTFNLTCPNTTLQNSPYFCKLNGTDKDGQATNFTSYNISAVTLFNISLNGTISFTPNQTHVGNHSMNITIQDNSSCSNGLTTQTFNLTVIDVNDAPYLIDIIPNQELDVNTNLYAFYLNDYFGDPDGDPLTYFYAIDSGSTLFNISIANDSQVLISSADCVEAYVYFVAADPYNLTNISNNVHLKVNCQEQGSSGNQNAGGGGSGADRVCEPDWHCTNWGPCLPNGTRERRCVDYNGCNPDDYIRYLTEACVYDNQTACDENWECTPWSACLNGNQTRNCTDLNACGTTKLVPNVTRTCELQQPGNVTIPPKITPPVTSFPWLTYILIFLILLAAILIILYRVYKKEIHELMTRVGWYFSKKRKKTILITDPTKDKLLKMLLDIEKNFGKQPFEKTSLALATVSRTYFTEAFALQYEHTDADFLKAWTAKKIDVLLKEFLKSYQSMLSAIEFSKKKPTPHELLTLLDELRLIIFQTSNATKEDGIHQIKQRTTSSNQPLDQIFTAMSNACIPAQFNETVFAKKAYFLALKRFETLKVSEQQHAYPTLHRLYQEINYVSHLVTL